MQVRTLLLALAVAVSAVPVAVESGAASINIVRRANDPSVDIAKRVDEPPSVNIASDVNEAASIDIA